jgi:hypothetical protein
MGGISGESRHALGGRGERLGSDRLQAGAMQRDSEALLRSADRFQQNSELTKESYKNNSCVFTKSLAVRRH